MTKRDFRIRRGLMRQGQIRNRKDFASFQGDYQRHQRDRSISRVATLVMIGLAIGLAIYLILKLS